MIEATETFLVVYTSWELKNVQNPDVSAEKMNTSPDSRIRMPKQTSAPHILLYSCDFFSKLVSRRSLFCRIDFFSKLDTIERLRDVLAIMIKWQLEW